MKTLCVFSTRTGLTQKIAEKIAAETGAELLEITDGKCRKGPFGYLSAVVAGLRITLPTLKPCCPQFPLEEYDRIILAAPIWCENISPIARAFVQENRDSFNGNVILVVTHMCGLSYQSKITALQRKIGTLQPSLSIQTKDYDWSNDVEEFIARLKRNL